MVWRINARGEREYSGGKEDWLTVASIAVHCLQFKPDEEDELVADEDVSCYNCRFRRWTAASFVCLHAGGYQENQVD